jgi:hypothetical protein
MDPASGNCEVNERDKCANSIHPTGPTTVVCIQRKGKEIVTIPALYCSASSLVQRLFEEAREHFSDRELVEIVALRGFCRTIAMLASVFELEIDSPSSYL